MITIEVGVLLVAMAIAWGTLKGSVGFNRRDIDRNTGAIETLSKENRAIGIDIKEIKVEQKYITQGINDIKETLKK